MSLAILDGESMLSWLNKATLNGKLKREARNQIRGYGSDGSDDSGDSGTSEDRRLRKMDSV